jgi:hypothetical protein
MITYYGIILRTNEDPPRPEPEIRLTITSGNGDPVADRLLLKSDGFAQITFGCPPLGVVKLEIDTDIYEWTAPAAIEPMTISLDTVIPRDGVYAKMPEVTEEPVAPSADVTSASIWLSVPRVLGMEL